MSTRKLVRLAGIVAIALLLLAGLVTWRFLGSLDARVQEIVEREASAATGTRVRLGSADVSLREGTCRLRDLRVANPEGFSDEDALRFDSITIKLDPARIRQRPLAIQELVLEAPRVLLEVDSAGRSNLDVLRKAVERHAAATTPETMADPLKMTIAKVQMPSGRVLADLSALTGRKDELELETVRLATVGGRTGSTADEIAKTLVAALVKETTRAAQRAGLSRYIDGQLGNEGSRVKDALGGLFKKR